MKPQNLNITVTVDTSQAQQALRSLQRDAWMVEHATRRRKRTLGDYILAGICWVFLFAILGGIGALILSLLGWRLG